MKRLEGKVALVTGAAGGIGRGIAIKFAREGAPIGVLDLNKEKCQTVVDEIVRDGGQALALEANIADETQVNAAIQTLRNRLGPVTVLVNNAAVMPAGLLTYVERTSSAGR
jgi:NAD(P)-dependent dehydrogenase (short-subunit alcohol dehydrogenase family)